MKRPLLIIGILLLAGAVVNVAVAWGCAAWGWRAPYTQVDQAGVRLAVQRVWDQYSPEGSPPFTEHYVLTDWGWICIGAVADSLQVGQIKVGSPFRTLQYSWFWGGGEPFFYNGWRVRSLTLPYKPIWPAFAINTSFYAAILWLLIPGPFVMRRLLRVRRGLCPKCAYPMGESAVCTECGGVLPQRPLRG